MTRLKGDGKRKITIDPNPLVRLEIRRHRSGMSVPMIDRNKYVNPETVIPYIDGSPSILFSKQSDELEMLKFLFKNTPENHTAFCNHDELFGFLKKRENTKIGKTNSVTIYTNLKEHLYDNGGGTISGINLTHILHENHVKSVTVFTVSNSEELVTEEHYSYSNELLSLYNRLN
jgi:hypothetical protein